MERTELGIASRLRHGLSISVTGVFDIGCPSRALIGRAIHEDLWFDIRNPMLSAKDTGCRSVSVGSTVCQKFGVSQGGQIYVREVVRRAEWGDSGPGRARESERERWGEREMGRDRETSLPSPPLAPSSQRLPAVACLLPAFRKVTPTWGPQS
jgi:hypothetical protein